MQVSVPSSARVPQPRRPGLCQGLSASVRLLFPEPCRGAVFGKHRPGAPAAGGGTRASGTSRWRRRLFPVPPQAPAVLWGWDVDVWGLGMTLGLGGGPQDGGSRECWGQVGSLGVGWRDIWGEGCFSGGWGHHVWLTLGGMTLGRWGAPWGGGGHCWEEGSPWLGVPAEPWAQVRSPQLVSPLLRCLWQELAEPPNALANLCLVWSSLTVLDLAPPPAAVPLPLADARRGNQDPDLPGDQDGDDGDGWGPG